MGSLITNIVRYVGFDVDNMSFQILKGHSLIDLPMMETMGLVKRVGTNVFKLVHAPPPPNVDEEEEEADIQDMMRRMDDLELQVRVINSNVGELTSLEHGIHQDITMINHNLLAYFQAQNFIPLPYPPHNLGYND